MAAVAEDQFRDEFEQHALASLERVFGLELARIVGIESIYTRSPRLSPPSARDDDDEDDDSEGFSLRPKQLLSRFARGSAEDANAFYPEAPRLPTARQQARVLPPVFKAPAERAAPPGNARAQYELAGGSASVGTAAATEEASIRGELPTAGARPSSPLSSAQARRHADAATGVGDSAGGAGSALARIDGSPGLASRDPRDARSFASIDDALRWEAALKSTWTAHDRRATSAPRPPLRTELTAEPRAGAAGSTPAAHDVAHGQPRAQCADSASAVRTDVLVGTDDSRLARMLGVGVRVGTRVSTRDAATWATGSEQNAGCATACAPGVASLESTGSQTVDPRVPVAFWVAAMPSPAAPVADADAVDAAHARRRASAAAASFPRPNLELLQARSTRRSAYAARSPVSQRRRAAPSVTDGPVSADGAVGAAAGGAVRVDAAIGGGDGTVGAGGYTGADEAVMAAADGNVSARVPRASTPAASPPPARFSMGARRQLSPATSPRQSHDAELLESLAAARSRAPVAADDADADDAAALQRKPSGIKVDISHHKPVPHLVDAWELVSSASAPGRSLMARGAQALIDQALSAEHAADQDADASRSALQPARAAVAGGAWAAADDDAGSAADDRRDGDAAQCYSAAASVSYSNRRHPSDGELDDAIAIANSALARCVRHRP
jgi:hypothetical protein